MRIGIDVDGVLANFVAAYERLYIEESGVNLFPCQGGPGCWPAVWEWPEHYGYDKQYTSRVWKRIKESRTFWRDLGVLPDLAFLKEAMPWAVHDVYFITARPGDNSKAQTERWLQDKLLPTPTVLITDQKGGACNVLNLDLYIDDKAENILDVQTASETRAYLCPQYPYNQHGDIRLRAGSIEEVFRREGVR